MEECIHPQLFDVVTLQCQNYSDVDCGQREEVVEYCTFVNFSLSLSLSLSLSRGVNSSSPALLHVFLSSVH